MSPQLSECPSEIRAALTGPWPTIRTPFTREGDIDRMSLCHHIDFMISGGAKAIVLTWGDSLYSVLTDDEVAEVTKLVVEHVRGRAVVVAADHIWWTGKCVQFADYCAGIGADMLMVLPPDWGASTTVESLVAHYGAVAEHIPVMVVTNYLAQRPQAFGLEVIQALYDSVPGIVALKNDVRGEFFRRVCLMTRDRWCLSSGGQKQNHMDVVPYGVHGFLSCYLTFKPEIAWRYWNAIQSHDLAAAVEVIRDYDMPFFDYILPCEGGFNAAMYAVFEIYGLTKRYRRPPYHTFTDRQMEELTNFLRRTGFL